jgi:hypothetical protein
MKKSRKPAPETPINPAYSFLEAAGKVSRMRGRPIYAEEEFCRFAHQNGVSSNEWLLLTVVLGEMIAKRTHTTEQPCN